MNQEMKDESQQKRDEANAKGLDPFFDINHDGKVSISETIKADAELAETYAESAKKKGGPKGKLAGLLSKLFKAVDKN